MDDNEQVMGKRVLLGVKSPFSKKICSKRTVYVLFVSVTSEWFVSVNSFAENKPPIRFIVTLS